MAVVEGGPWPRPPAGTDQGDVAPVALILLSRSPATQPLASVLSPVIAPSSLTTVPAVLGVRRTVANPSIEWRHNHFKTCLFCADRQHHESAFGNFRRKKKSAANGVKWALELLFDLLTNPTGLRALKYQMLYQQIGERRW